jgi:hypothetical protein
MTVIDSINAQILKDMEAKGIKHYKGRAECFADVISAFNIINDYNKDKGRMERIYLISPTILGSPMGDTDFDFWLDGSKTILEVFKLWDDKGTDLHRMIQTTKPFYEYDGKVDYKVFEKLK